MKKILTLEVISLISCFVMMIINIMVCFIPLNGKLTIIELVNLYPNLMTPANYTFLIFIFIFLSITVFSMYITAAAYRNKQNLYPALFYIFFIITCVTDIGWIIAWSYNYLALSVVLSITGVLVLFRMNEILVNSEAKLIRIPFQLYFGWMMVICASGIMALITSIGLMSSLKIEEYLTVFLIILISTASVYLVVKYHYVFSVLSVIWAYIGMLVMLISKSGSGKQYLYIIITIIISITILAGSMLMGGYRFIKDSFAKKV